MKRFAIQELEKWRLSSRRKPLIIEGARQVGKTWLVKEFAARFYDNIAYINFEKEVYLRNMFTEGFNTERLIGVISAATHVRIEPGKTLIFLDEIQEAENGITSLKYFQEDAPEYHIVVAGSLLGLELHRQVSFPVGKVQFLTLRPMSFLEFLDALGEGELSKYIMSENVDMMNLFAPKLRELLKQYYYVGGMPEAVLSFCERHDWGEVREIQEDILRSYDFDFSKHAPAEIVPRIRMLWESVPSQLSRENKKFLYGLIKEGARAREYELALQWLFDSGLIYKVSNVVAPRMPLKGYVDSGAFKIYIVDIGLLGAMSGLDSSTVVDGNRIFTEFKGALTEQYVLQELILKYTPFYYSKSNSRQEVDFLIQKDGHVMPIEVKAEENLKSKSLRQFVEENQPDNAYRFSMSNFRKETWMTNIPLFAVETI